MKNCENRFRAIVVLLQTKTEKTDNKMKNTNPIFSLKNFRSFGEDGADFELAPITVLTGCNSAGKSSLVKALLLLNKLSNTGAVDAIIDLGGDYLPVSTKELNLGRFDKVINDKTEEKEFELSYLVWSSILRENVKVIRVFMANRHDAMNNGKLKELRIEREDGGVIYSKGRRTSTKGIWSYSDEFFNPKIIDDKIQQFDVVSEFLRIQKVYNAFLRRLENANDSDDLKLKVEAGKKVLDDLKRIMQALSCTESDYDYSICAKWNENKYGDPLMDSDAVLEYKKDCFQNNSREVFVKFLAEEVVSQALASEIQYVNSDSAKIKRLYSFEDEDKLCVAIRHFFKRIEKCKTLNDTIYVERDVHYQVGEFFREWLGEKHFDIGDDISYQDTDEGLGFLLYLVKGGEKRLLADEGYGITQLFTLLLHIDNLIPIIKDRHLEEEDAKSFQKPIYVCVEEPENHLHPKFQSMLAEMFVEAYQEYNIHFIIETHSEYLIRKLQVMVANKRIKSNDVSLNYVEKNEEGISYNRQIRIQDSGRLDGSFGKGFYDEAGGLSRQLFMLND